MVRDEADDTSVPPDNTRLNHAKQYLVAQSYG